MEDHLNCVDTDCEVFVWVLQEIVKAFKLGMLSNVVKMSRPASENERTRCHAMEIEIADSILKILGHLAKDSVQHPKAAKKYSDVCTKITQTATEFAQQLRDINATMKDKETWEKEEYHVLKLVQTIFSISV